MHMHTHIQLHTHSHRAAADTGGGDGINSVQDFDAAWKLQAGNEGLVGALVAFGECSTSSISNL